MELFKEQDILNKKVRLKLIEEIEGPENKSRKMESLKRYEILKDRIKKYILQNLMKELDPETVQDMESRIATVNIYKKVIGKKARVYKTAPKREAMEGTDQDQLDMLIDKVKLNVSMKKANKYLEAMLNTDVFVRPIKNVHELTDQGNPTWEYRVDPLAPHNYDVIEDANDNERAIGYLLSNFDTGTGIQGNETGERDSSGTITSNFRDGDNKDQTIADSPNDKDKEYVWWGHTYHVTFNADGDIIVDRSGDNNLNPIKQMPFVSLAKERDGSFWALGGDDLIEGSILINTILSDIYYIAKMHGTGLFYLFGKGVPKTHKVGPNQAITMNVEEGDPIPTIGFANANPQLSDHRELVEQYLAMLLTTNDLEPGSVQGSLSATSATSGVQEMIIKAEPMGSVENDQELFKDAEPEIVNIVGKWHNLYFDKGLLTKKLTAIGKLPTEIDYTIKFGAIQQFMNEKEKLEVIKSRLELKLDTIIDAMILDNPDLSRQDAELKLTEDLKFRTEQAATAMANMIEEGSDGIDQESDKDSTLEIDNQEDIEAE